MVSNIAVFVILLLLNIEPNSGAALNSQGRSSKFTKSRKGDSQLPSSSSERSNATKTSNGSCIYPGTPEHGRLTTTCDLDSFQPGEELEYMCEFMYRPIGPTKRTCLPNGTWSGVQPRCQVFMCEEPKALDHGYAYKKKAPVVGVKQKFKCFPNYQLKGNRMTSCLQNGHWSAKPPTCEHVCKTIKCGSGEMCRVVNGKPTCACRDNMDCVAMYDPVCASNGVTYNNECIMNATSCRIKQKIRRIRGGHCVPGDTCSIIPISNCRAAFDVYFYNVSLGRCQNMIAGGCHPSGWNGFLDEKECQNICVPDVCGMNPEQGPCINNQVRWYHNATTTTCETFEYGGCFGNPNNFRTKNDCLERCGTNNYQGL